MVGPKREDASQWNGMQYGRESSMKDPLGLHRRVRYESHYGIANVYISIFKRQIWRKIHSGDRFLSYIADQSNPASRGLTLSSTDHLRFIIILREGHRCTKTRLRANHSITTA